MSDYIPRWHRELCIFSRIKPLLIVEGNVLDVYQMPGDGYIMRLPEYLHELLTRQGYSTIAFFDGMQGFYQPVDSAHLDRFAQLVGQNIRGGRIPCEFRGKGNSASAMVRVAMAQSDEPVAVVFNLASRYIVSPDHLQQAEVDGFTNLLLASMEAQDVPTGNGTLKNLIILIVGKTNDIPVWLYMDNPNVKTIHISTPSREEREALVKGDNFRSFFDRSILLDELPYYQQHTEELSRIQDRFVGLTEGFSFTEINGLRRLCKNERMHIRQLASVIDLYKYGIAENPWDRLDEHSLSSAPEDFRRRVKGQDAAIGKTLDVIKRAVTGLSGLQGSSHNRPKGVLFFAGPTGTGKTETAKTLAEKIFGDEKCCIRFDMSEYSQSHSDQKLLGAPPGYVGYESGGQLTNAVRENPFSILLFDEIEKAHPSILDKFLQILEDGRMTDGQGNTVYFSECIIIFTSNLGIYTHDANGQRYLNVNFEMPYAEVSKRVRGAIEDYFKLELGRPEILNRIGENIVVFDFIRPDVAQGILYAQIDRIKANLKEEKNIRLNLSDTAYESLLKKALSNLDNGGRGIGNIVESLLLDPLARYLFDHGIRSSSSVTIQQIISDQFPVQLICETIKESAVEN